MNVVEVQSELFQYTIGSYGPNVPPEGYFLNSYRLVHSLRTVIIQPLALCMTGQNILDGNCILKYNRVRLSRTVHLCE